MTRLTMLLFTVISTTLMGTCVIVALVMGHDTRDPIIVAAVVGFLAAFPVSWFVARAIA